MNDLKDFNRQMINLRVIIMRSAIIVSFSIFSATFVNAGLAWLILN